jgi:hypothetical protein
MYESFLENKITQWKHKKIIVFGSNFDGKIQNLKQLLL